jgi:hypothetical protein
MPSRIDFLAAGALMLMSSLPAQQTSGNIDDFFRGFTAEWIRFNPELATSTRYLKGEEQDRLERQLTPQTLAYRRARIELARKGLTGLE